MSHYTYVLVLQWLVAIELGLVGALVIRVLVPATPEEVEGAVTPCKAGSLETNPPVREESTP